MDNKNASKGKKNISWLAILGLSIGILEVILLIVPLVIAIIYIRLSLDVGLINIHAFTIPLELLLPVGLVGLIINLIANHQIKKHGIDGQKQARWGIVFSFIGFVPGILLLLVMSGVFSPPNLSLKWFLVVLLSYDAFRLVANSVARMIDGQTYPIIDLANPLWMIIPTLEDC